MKSNELDKLLSKIDIYFKSDKIGIDWLSDKSVKTKLKKCEDLLLQVSTYFKCGDKNP
jgi:hypothetical protein